MIKIDFLKHCDKLISFNISGHAGFDESGRDIICSAVSVLSGAVVNGVTDVLKIDAPYDFSDGHMIMSLDSLSNEEIEKCQVLMETMLVSLKSLEVNYKDYVNVHIKEV
ncbi:ribosomal-processing cysteine protease Prp [Clostridium bornimense]|uniref:ribosomal-processing cysteine protease Prp n=1 Tax=Clostridium bornimense TaxID=1216932 RepID=UPI001C1168B6|nr:ribosomal-processing cysteine protease Prp [Clostridium bornimense]MBU5315783.1 ribosomal-processing cysteine protease Prp [Clostridium bornimense]